jgi:DNA phosphorothioation-dependent restriction protein DptH
MNKLVTTLAEIVRDKVRRTTRGVDGTRVESRSIFNGPPLHILEMVFDELSLHGGILVSGKGDEDACLPVVLQITSGKSDFLNPDIGASGHCDETHLLNLRNDPSSPSFIALVPPGQHNNRSVASTTEEFGVDAACNNEHATFDDWWRDEFVQTLLVDGLTLARIDGKQLDEARTLVEHSARALDEVASDMNSRSAAWRVLSRIYSIPALQNGLTPAQSVSLACGVPAMQDDGISAKSQVRVLEQLARALADGFKVGLEQVKNIAHSSESALLDTFLTHIQKCRIPTAFERATPAFYLPEDSLDLSSPPAWWIALTVERWSELLAEEIPAADDLEIECTNPIFTNSKGIPTLVLHEVKLSLSAGKATSGPVAAILERNAGGKNGKRDEQIELAGQTSHDDNAPPSHKAPIRYRVEADGYKGAGLKVISLSNWYPGIFVTCRAATKLAPPKAPKKGSRAPFEWVMDISVLGGGRYELAIFLSPHASIGEMATGVRDDATEGNEESQKLPIRKVKEGEFQVEIEADGKYQIDIPFNRTGLDGVAVAETCRVYVTCEETSEEGCRSEFERLIKMNRQHLEHFEGKSVVQLDRNSRTSSLQSWMLDEQFASKSFRPIVIADDYSTSWIPPDWDLPAGPILSFGRFLHDPRPSVDEFIPPIGFIEARIEIARKIRNTDEQSGLAESAPFGAWVTRDPEFKALIESYLDSYLQWLASSPEIACWVDAVLVTSLEPDKRTLGRIPDAILLSPLHPVRLAWHCVAQQALYDAAMNGIPCPAVSVMDPDCIPDILSMSLRAPDGIEQVDFLSVECNSDYWSVLWNSSRLAMLAEKPQSPFDGGFGLSVGGISSGFSAAQVSRALEDVSDLLAAKSIVNIVISSTGGATDACNDGLVDWCTNRFGVDDKARLKQSVGPRMVQVFDTRSSESRPDDATIANLSEDTGNHVRWFDRQPRGATPDLGIIAQLDSSEPETTQNATRSPLSMGALIRHRVRRQLPGGARAFLSESRQGLPMPPSGDVLADKVANGVLALEHRSESRVGLRFAPNVHAVQHMLKDLKADFVAVSSAAIDPACFLGQWTEGAYLWDYDLPSYSSRAGDNNGYYLLSQVRAADEQGLAKVLSRLPGCDQLSTVQAQQILLEVARRGIPTVRGLAGDDTGATGDLGLFLAVRLLQDQFRLEANTSSLLPVFTGTETEAMIAIIVPVDPFRGYLADLGRSLKKEFKDVTLSRPDLLVVGIELQHGAVRIKLTPIEVKCRQGSVFPEGEIEDALDQAKALSTLFAALADRSEKSLAWRVAYQHLLLSMIGFGLRVYSQHQDIASHAARWSGYHELITGAILGNLHLITVDKKGRLVIVDDSMVSDAFDRDGDDFKETIVIGSRDAGRIVIGDADNFYAAVRAKVGNWSLMPELPIDSAGARVKGDDSRKTASADVHSNAGDTAGPFLEPEDGPSAPTEKKLTVEEPPDQGSVFDGNGILLSIGRSTDGFEPRPLSLNISDTRLNNLNIGVVGDLGTGKTQLLKSLIFQITSAKVENRGIAPRFLIFDYKRDYSTDDFVKATGARVVKPYQLPLNLFDTRSLGESPPPWLERFRFFADILDKIYSGIGPVQRDKLKGAVRTAYEACSLEGRQPSIYDVHSEYRKLLGGKSDSPMAIIDDLVDMEIFARDQSKCMQFDDFLDGVVVVSLDAMGQDDRSKNMLVAIMLNMFYENMLKTPKRPFKGSDPQLRVIDSYLLVDEADNIMRYEFDVLRSLLLQGREFGAGVILASQYLRHFKVNSTDYRDPLLTWFIHKVPNVTPTELSALGFTSDVAELCDRVKTMPNHHCLYKSSGVAGEVIRGTPFYELKRLLGPTAPI